MLLLLLLNYYTTGCGNILFLYTTVAITLNGPLCPHTEHRHCLVFM